MKTTIKSKNLEITEEIKEYIEKKTGALEKFITIPEGEERKTLKEVIVEVGKVAGQEKGPVFRAEMQMHLPGKTLYAESTTENLYMSINETKEELEREIKKYKGKKDSLKKRGGKRGKRMLRWLFRRKGL